MERESLLIATLVELADNLVDDYDIIDVLTVLSLRCVEAVDVDAAGVMLASPVGELQFVASSSESMTVLELFQIQANEGPCVDCFRGGRAITNHALSESDGRWPLFTPRVAGLNPHAGEGGLLGGEERTRSLPGILRARARLRAAHIDALIDGPVPSESAFRLAQAGQWDGVAAMYHD